MKDGLVSGERLDDLQRDLIIIGVVYMCSYFLNIVTNGFSAMLGLVVLAVGIWFLVQPKVDVYKRQVWNMVCLSHLKVPVMTFSFLKLSNLSVVPVS